MNQTNRFRLWLTRSKFEPKYTREQGQGPVFLGLADES